LKEKGSSRTKSKIFTKYQEARKAKYAQTINDHVEHKYQ